MEEARRVANTRYRQVSGRWQESIFTKQRRELIRGDQERYQVNGAEQALDEPAREPGVRCLKPIHPYDCHGSRCDVSSSSA